MSQKIFDKSVKISLDLYPRDNLIRGRFYHVALLFKRNTPVAIGTNIYETHPKILKMFQKFNIDNENYFVHAETNVISKVNNLDGLKMVVLRINKNGLALSKPCINCATILRALKIPTYYSTQNGFELFA